MVPGGYNRLLEVINRFLEVITGPWRLKPAPGVYNRFLEDITDSWRL